MLATAVREGPEAMKLESLSLPRTLKFHLADPLRFDNVCGKCSGSDWAWGGPILRLSDAGTGLTAGYVLARNSVGAVVMTCIGASGEGDTFVRWPKFLAGLPGDWKLG